MFGFNVPKIDKYGKAECAIDSGHIFQAQGAITNIKTAKSKKNPNIFFMVLSDQSGFIYILQGNSTNVHSYEILHTFNGNNLL